MKLTLSKEEVAGILKQHFWNEAPKYGQFGGVVSTIAIRPNSSDFAQVDIILRAAPASSAGTGDPFQPLNAANGANNATATLKSGQQESRKDFVSGGPKV